MTTGQVSGAQKVERTLGDHLADLYEWAARALEATGDDGVDFNTAELEPDSWRGGHVEAAIAHIWMTAYRHKVPPTHLRKLGLVLGATLDGHIKP